MAPPQAPAPPRVEVAKPAQRTVTNFLYFTGRTRAVEQAEIRARVPGYLEAMHFELADNIEAGAKLFTIEPAVYIARKNQMAAALASAEANLSRAESDLTRVKKAVETNAVSQQEVETRRAERDMAKAAVLEAEANLKQAELDLSYCTVTSPIAGQVSRDLVDVGNLVGAGENTLLTTVAKMDPIHVYFEASELVLLQWLRTHDRSLEDRSGEFPAFLGLSNDEDYPFEGLIDHVENSVDISTGTIQLRASFPNPNGKLFPGLFAKVRIPGMKAENAVLVKERAIGTDLGGKYVLTVDAENMVVLKHVKLGALEGDERVILEGLGADENYIVKGLMRARPGLPCTPVAGGTQPADGTATNEG